MKKKLKLELLMEDVEMDLAYKRHADRIRRVPAWI